MEGLFVKLGQGLI